jgi:hypothetical protein
MSDARPKQIQEIEGLLAERRKYEQWLAQLDARKESTPSHVFVKVHRDYTARLTEAQQKLSSETGAVNALAAELGESLAKQDRQITERADERAEAELRASVGEFAGKEWDKLRTKLDSAIAELTSERESVQRELDTLRALLSEAEPSAEPKRDVDDIAFLRSVLGRSTPYSSTPAPVISEPPMAERVSARVSVPVEKRPSVETSRPIAEEPTAPNDAPAVRASVEAPRVSVEAARVSVEAPRVSVDAPRVSTEVPRTSSTHTRGSSAVSAPELFAMPEIPQAPEEISGPRGSDDMKPSRPSGTFGQATPRTSEAVKSLKCQECGTLNYPTEWYCERCGGELAAF